jgi:hypothetical protein
MTFLKRHIEIILILVLGFALRFTISVTHSYSNDELSAINRLSFSNFHDLIESGVKTGDMHPAGVQVFMKGWEQLAGTSEAGMRLPFVICGVLAILFLYKIGLEWFSKYTALFASAFLAFLYFPVINSEFARPYSPGLLFSVLAAWLCLRLLFSEKRSYLQAIGLGIAFAAAMYTHYFAFMFVGWMGISSLIFMNKANFKHLILAGVVAIGLFLPHVAVTQYHLSVGGLGWLKVPEPEWLLNFLHHVFNESFLLICGILALLILALIFNTKVQLNDKRQLILVGVWFFGIYLVGHIYSIFETPVLKFPVMLFALPFLLLSIGHVLAKSQFKQVTLVLLIGMISLSTIFEKKLFGNMHYELFKEVSDDILYWEDEYGAEDIYTVYNLNNPNYMNFYAGQEGREIQFDWDVIEFGDAARLREDLKNRNEEYCIVGYSARLTLLQVFETCREFYPEVVTGTKYNNAAVYLLKKSNDRKDEDEILADFPSNQFVSNAKLFVPLDTNVNSNAKGYRLANNDIYGPEFHFELSDIIDHENKYIRVEVEANILQDGQLTAAFTATRKGVAVKNSAGEDYWEGRDLEVMLKDTGKAYFAFSIPDFIQYGDDLMISFWNRNPNSEVIIKSVKIFEVDNIWN